MTKYPEIEFRHIRYFLAASDYSSFRKTSSKLSVQESTISRAVRDLEDRLGASLFQRNINGVKLTFAGEQFRARACAAIKQIDAGIKEVRSIGLSECGKLTIGIFSSLASGFLYELLKQFNKEHSDVQVLIADGNPTEHVASIRRFELDVAFVTGTRKWLDCDTEQLWSERVFAVLPCDHGLASKERLNWLDLENECFIVSDAAPGPEIHDYLVQRLADLGHHPQVETQKIGRDNILSLVAVGHGLTLTSEATTVAHIPGITYRPIADELLPFCAVWSPGNDNPALRRFLSLARRGAKAGAASSEPS